jgi:hypothetical protein
MVKRAIAVVAGTAALSLVWAAPALAQTGNQSFNIRYTASRTGTVNASGPISGTGRAIRVNDSTDRLIFKTGTVTLTRQMSSHNENFDPNICGTHVNESGRYQIKRGTKNYRRASGNGTYSLQGKIVSARGTKNNCFGSRRDVFTGTLTAHGSTQLRRR